MGLLDFFTIHVFSDVTGIVTMNGKAVEGADIIRTADHTDDKLYTDSTTTDKEGNFSLPDISTFSFRPIMLPTVIFQKMIIKYQGMEYLAWEMTKRTNHRYGELNDINVENQQKLKLVCELTEKQDKYLIKKIRHRNTRITGICNLLEE